MLCSELCIIYLSVGLICAELRANQLGVGYSASAQCRWNERHHRPTSEECVGNVARRSKPMVGEQ
jgi:hypothetical protein